MSLIVSNLCISIGHKTIVENLNITLHKGQIIGLFGPNGSGKSSAFYAIAGLYEPLSGSICIETHGTIIDTTKLPLFQKVRLGLGYLPQDRTLLMDLTTEENIWAVIETQESFAKNPQQQLDYLLDCFGLNGVRHNLGKFLSGGERRRCELACLLAHQPTYLLLDEPFAGIDPISIKQIKSILCHLKQHHGILITDHQVIETMNICDDVLVMRHGKLIAQGTPESVRQHKDVQSFYLGETNE